MVELTKHEYTTETFLAWLKKKYGKKLSGEEFNTNDVGQYLLREMLPFRYSGRKLTSRKVAGVRIITIGEKV